MTNENHINMCGYNPSHPWYYKLGGRVLFPKDILHHAKASGYRGYAAEHIKAADMLEEPKRSEKLRILRARFLMELEGDITVYRQKALALSRERKAGGDIHEGSICNDIYTSMSLKYSHLYNGFAHLVWLDDLLTQQGDLFGF